MEAVRSLEFNPSLLGSRSYNKRKLLALDDALREALFAALLKVSGKYSMLLSQKNHYVRKAEFSEWLAEQDGYGLALYSAHIEHAGPSQGVPVLVQRRGGRDVKNSPCHLQPVISGKKGGPLSETLYLDGGGPEEAH